MAYTPRIGGDHFEYRPLDVYWPLLAVQATVGIWHLGTGLAAAGRWLRLVVAWRPAIKIWIYALVLFLPVVLLRIHRTYPAIFWPRAQKERPRLVADSIWNANAGFPVP